MVTGLGRLDVPLRKVCTYCDEVMAEGHPEAATSHGICPACEPRVRAPRLFDLIDDVGAAIERTARGHFGAVNFLAARRVRLEALLRCLKDLATSRPRPVELGPRQDAFYRERFL